MISYRMRAKVNAKLNGVCHRIVRVDPSNRAAGVRAGRPPSLFGRDGLDRAALGTLLISPAIDKHTMLVGPFRHPTVSLRWGVGGDARRSSVSRFFGRLARAVGWFHHPRLAPRDGRRSRVGRSHRLAPPPSLWEMRRRRRTPPAPPPTALAPLLPSRQQNAPQEGLFVAHQVFLKEKVHTNVVKKTRKNAAKKLKRGGGSE